MRILIVEDEKRIASFIKRGLEEEAHAVDVAYDGEEGLNWITSFNYDLIIMDILMPKMDGITLCRTIREQDIDTPVLMLTAKDAVDDRVEGLDAGADDYLVKPFAFKELLARIRALSRRWTDGKGNTLEIGGLKLDLVTRRTVRGGKEIELTNREFALLELLMRNTGHVLSRTIIAEHIWDYNFLNQSNVVDVYIRQLRRKIDESFEEKLIQTVRGSGYKIQGGTNK
ncbi:response regulator with CheY-like receiver domain and winged-helix DNA-binding domain [Desulfosporosinus orientis DSM 765]|uniref:Stage 0 sporulation protein A homolog n=1 Tax=Desulfosporosinus orientis (strain ATCC 19365 / DSM 765 / NCIMB 8382 / VKM B-1628 / Singapore I) TaxID=768706 RepID=G7WDD3_DESOD|nr:response regulator transcription factor [Desulfosporosinus orientis]AET67902.1 response regulator with CheY-like receiver domain and winged-helix DNA-binding domain [Desulfosporosinus orientis DSM 765]